MGSGLAIAVDRKVATRTRMKVKGFASISYLCRFLGLFAESVW